MNFASTELRINKQIYAKTFSNIRGAIKMKKILFALLSVILMLSISSLGMFDISAKAAETSGTTGDCTWSIEGDTLTISGNGAMGYGKILSSSWNSKITNLVIKNGVTHIGGQAFSDLHKITSITIPNSVTSIDHNAFSGCSNLSNITIPDSVTSISSLVFYETEYYNNPNNWVNDVLYIGNHLIAAKQSITQYTIKSGTKTIAGYAFLACTNLTSITIPNSVKSICYGAFEECYKLTNITIPNSITSIETNAFYDCNSLTNITIPNSVISIGKDVFGYCSSLTSITIPTSVKSFDGNLSSCKKLNEVSILSNTTNVSLSGEKLKKLTLSKSITKIDGDFTKSSDLVINYNGTRTYWDTVELSGSLQRAILEERAKVICEDDNKPTTSSKPTQNNSTSSKPSGNANSTSKPSTQNTESVPVQNTESSNLTETESEPTDDTSSQNSAQIDENKGSISVITFVLAIVGAFVLGAGAAVGVLLFLKKKNIF